MQTAHNDYTLGIYQAIGNCVLLFSYLMLTGSPGYKEFHNYLTASEPSEKEFSLAVEEMKQSTRQYAKRQVSWIRNKLLPAVYAANKDYADDSLPCPNYLLDATGALADGLYRPYTEIPFCS